MGFDIIKKEVDFVIAKPYKAIFDYLSYRIPKHELTKDKIDHYLEEFRLDSDMLKAEDYNKLLELLK
jgi:hypothetical protein